MPPTSSASTSGDALNPHPRATRPALPVTTRGAALVLAASMSATACADLLLHDAWMGAVPPTSKVAAVYLVLENTGPAALELRRATSPDFPRVELHQSVHADGRVRMEARETLTLAPGERIDFSRTGHHFMIWFTGRPVPAPGETVRLALEVEGGTPLSVQAEVRRPGEAANHDAHAHDPAHHDHDHPAPREHDLDAEHPGPGHGPALGPEADPHAGH